MKKRASRKIISIILSMTLFMVPGNMLLPGFPHPVFAEEYEDALQAGGATSTSEITPSIYEVDPDSVPTVDTDEPEDQTQGEQTQEDLVPEEINPEEAPEELLEEEVVEFESEPDPNEVAKGLEDRPDPLSLEDLIDDFGIQPPAQPLSTLQDRIMLFSTAVETNPVTIVIGDDNDNNAHTGVSDGDIDYNISATKANYPVEISFDLDALPTESAYIAIKAYDVDEEAGEKDYVFINDAPMAPGTGTNSIGCLSGNNNTWNTTVLQIPLSKLKLGKNYISISITRGWWTTVDWAQLILDGGSADENVSEFSIKLGDAIQNGSQVEIAATVNITQDGSKDYHTEYMLTNVKGENLDSAFGTASSTETAMLTMPLSSPSGTYTVTGLIKGEDETIKASDTITFDFVSGEVPTFGPKISYRLQPATLTNGNVVIQLEAENMNPTEISDVEIWYQSGDITDSSNGTITSAYQSVSESGTYSFTIKFVRNGIERISGYNVKIDNIDKKKPVILFAGNVNVLEETPDDQVLAAIAGNITVKDDISLPANPYTISPNSDLAAIPGEKTITVTARDTAGNEETKNLTVMVLPKPVQLAQNEPVMDGTSHIAALSAAIEYTGGLNITEYGFVWGVSQNPTPSVCNGIASIAGTLEKGETFNAAAADISEGINYYVRAYVKAGNKYYYSDQKSFNIGAPQYGNFSVSTEATRVSCDGGTAVFTISRPAGQTEGDQTVSYRTVNGTAIGGIHFQHKLSTITFSDGEDSKVIEVPVYGIAREYGSNPATAYQNTQRNFYLEIYKVQGGATINGTASMAKKTIDLDSTKEVDANTYNQYNSVNTVKGAVSLITDDGSNNGSIWEPNADATDLVSFTKLGNTDGTYLDKTADHYALKYDLTISEQDDGYELMQVTTQNAPYNFGHLNVNYASGSELYYALAFEHDTSGTYGTAKTYTFPSTTARAQAVYSKSAVKGYSGILIDGGTAINIGNNKMVYVHYSASGGANDKWEKSGFQPSVRAIDIKEPQLLAVAPMAGGTYSFGDTVYVSLIFNEIVDSLSGAVTLKTNLSGTPFSYVEGEGTNVLVFKGKVNLEGQSFSQLIITAIKGSGNIKDMSVATGFPTPATGDSTEFEANTVRPLISFAGSSTGTLPRHTAEIAITDAASACYTWSMNSEMPVSGWMDLPDATGGTMTETLTGGESGSAAVWYLHVLATHSNGNILWAVKEFNFQQPTLNATVSHPDQWLPGKEITLSVTGSAPVNVAMTGPKTGNYTENTVITATTAGTYTFTLTDEYGSNIVKRLDVSRIDHTKPEIVIREYGDTAVKYTSLDFGVSAADDEGGSGIASLEYAWTGSTAVPTDWMPMAAEGGLIPTYNTVGTVYLHVKAVDTAGNTNYACSGAYTVMDNTPPQIDIEFLNGALEAWQSGSVSLRYVVTKTSGDIKSINAADQILENGDLPSSYPYEDTVEVDRNGMVSFMVSDENGLSDTASLVVNYLDNEAPSVSVGYGSGNTAASWAKTKTVILNANDSTSPVIDGSGAITAYSGSGVASLEWKKQGESSYHSVSDGSFTADENTTYFIKAADACGNSSEYNISISGIDTTAPNVNISAPTDWQNANYSAAVSYGDDYSGIASAKYAVASSNVSIPGDLSVMPASGGSIAVTGQGSSYIYYIVTDKAGNTTEGWTGEIKLDKEAPVLTVTPYCETEGGAAYVPGQWTSSDVVFKLGNSTSQISGTVYQVSIDDGPWNTLAGDTSIIAANTNKNYRFRALSGAGLSDTCGNISVKIHKSMQDQAMEASMLSPSPNTEDSWYRNETVITIAKPSAEDSGPAVTVNYKLWKEGEGEPVSASVLGGETIAIPADGIWTLKIWTEDEAGNSTEPLICHYYVDTAEPVFESVQYQLINDDGSYGEFQSFDPNKNFFRQAVHVTVKIGDILSGAAKISRLYDGISEELLMDENGTATFDLGPDFDGSVVIGAVDKAGNAVMDEDKAVINLISEQHSPVIVFGGAAVTEESKDIWLQGAQTVEITADDASDGATASSLDKMSVSVKRWDGTAYTESMDGISCSFEGLSEAAATTAKTHELILSSSGRYEITVSAVDRAGNQAALQTRYIRVDTDLPAGAPQLTLNGVEIDNDAYYQAKDYLVVPSVENDEKQSPVRAQYQLTNDAEPDKNVTVWTDIPENHTLSVNEGTNRVALRTTDLSGNTGSEVIYTLNRDNTRPSASVSVSTDWQNSDYSAAVSYGDDYSSIASAKYAVVSSNVSIPEDLSVMPASGGSIAVTGQGSSYIYYIVTDKAGNTTEGWTGEIKLDKEAPVLIVTPYCETEGGTAYAPGQWTSSDVVFKLGNSTSQISGTVYQVSIDDGPWNTLAGDTSIISANTNKNYRFRAVSGAGLSDTCGNISVKIHKSMQDQAMEASMLSPSPNTEDSWYRNETVITIAKPSAADSGPAVTVNYKLWKEGEGEPVSASVLGGETIAIPADGIWTLKIWTADEAGNSTDPLISHYYVDTAEPVFKSVQYQLINDDGSYGEFQSFDPNKNFFRQAVHVTVKIGDILSGSAKISRLYDGISEELLMDENGTATFDLGPDFDGSVVIGAIDKAGNAVMDEDKAVINLISEQHSPVIVFGGAAVTEEPEDIWLQGAQTVEITADDASDGATASSLDKMSVSVKRWDGTAYTESMDGISCSFEGLSEAAATTAKTHELILSSSGRYEITVSAVDRAGNQAALQTRYIRVDTDLPAGAPQLTLNGVEIDNDAYYQAKDYLVVPSVENDEKQSPVRAQYQLTNDAEPDKNVTVWTDIPENHTLSVNEGTNRVALRTTDLSGNTGSEVIYTLNRDNTRPDYIEFSPANGASEVSTVATISFMADEPLMKGKGYITIYNKSKNLKVLDLHSSNNRVKLSNENRTVTITLPAALEADTEYELLMDEGFVSDRAGNQGLAIAAESSWCFATAAATAIPDEEIVVLGYTVELISKSGPDGQETIQTVTAPADREAERQHNIVAKASYSINGTDYYVKLRVRPLMNAEPELINVSVSEGTATLSDDKQFIDVLIPVSVGEVLMTISLGSGTANQFSIKIINSEYTALVETSGGINATADEGNLLNAVDLSKEVEIGQLPDTSVDVTVKLDIAEKTETDIPDLEEIQQTVPGAALRFLSITMEKIVKTTVEGSSSSTETTAITATQQPVVIIIDIPEEIQGQYIYKIIREHDGIRDILPAEVIDKGTRLRFETDRFSRYTIAAAAAPRHGNNKKEIIKPVSVTAGSKRMTVELDKLAIEENVEKNVLLPYFIESEEEFIVPFSIVQNGEIKWIAEQGQTYWFKCNQKQFEDIYDHWAEEDILFCAVRELFDGTGAKQFSPDIGMTRGMYVTVLGRLWKVDTDRFGTSRFDDVKSGDWCAPYIDWAVQSGIVDGFGNELFQPNQMITREQMALITARFIKYAELDLKPVNGAEVPADRFAVSDWAADEAWLMLETGLIKGKPHNVFDPQGNVTRSEAAAVIKRLIENTVQ